VSNDDRVEILKGVVAGETVVASATFLVDAESSLRTALGGMGNMPGMDMTTPPKPLPTKKE
jgi:membrane fusion protein, copper/silver efflux system